MSKHNPIGNPIGIQLLTQAEFRAAVVQRGWTYAALAKRWGVTANWISKLAGDINRPMHWDDAVRGLPYIAKKP